MKKILLFLLFMGMLHFGKAQTSIPGNLGYGTDLILYQGKFYGTYYLSNGTIAIFEYDPAKENIVKKADLFFATPSATFAYLTLVGDIFYGVTKDNVGNNPGVIFTWNPATNIVEKKIDLNNYINFATGAMSFYNGKLYGFSGSRDDNSESALYEYDPNNNRIQRKVNLTSLGIGPDNSPVFCNNKMYGINLYGGTQYNGTLYEWDPATNVVSIKHVFDGATGKNPTALIVANNKLYGSAGTNTSGTGVFFEYDPSTNIYSVKNTTPYYGDCFQYNPANGRFYGAGSGGGSNGLGYLFEWNPTTNNNQLLINYSFENLDGGNTVLTPAFGKIYQLSGESIFEWDPSFNTYTNKVKFLYNAPAPSCQPLSGVTIDASNNNVWVPIKDSNDSLVAEIKANGNNLGYLSASLFVNFNAVREDGNRKLYLDRNITLGPKVQPTSPVSIRLYIKESELLNLIAAHNSIYQTSGVNSVNDLGIYRPGGSCSPSVAALNANAIIPTVTKSGDKYILSADVSSLSTFYFAAKTKCTAPVISNAYVSNDTIWPPYHSLRTIGVAYKTTPSNSNCGTVTNWLTVSCNELETGMFANDQGPDWEVVDANHVRLRAERRTSSGATGREYTITIHSQNGPGFTSTADLKVYVPLTMPAAKAKKFIEEAKAEEEISSAEYTVSPNPSNRNFTLRSFSAVDTKAEVALTDVSGRLLSKFNLAKNSSTTFGTDLKPGLYFVRIQRGNQQKVIKIIKQ